jgi:outer membrane protein OmpA-like peptidoglycan-associated protein
LCNGECPPPPGATSSAAEDDVSRVNAHLGLSVTVLPFLEAFAGFHSHATFNDQGRPQLLSVLGDTNLGVKGFMPAEPERLFSAGGQAELWLLNGTGSVGIDGGGTSFALRGLATLDFNNRLNPNDRMPVRLHFNMGYMFDNSGTLVNEVEARRNSRVTRIERFGLDVNRVDSFTIGLGADFPVHEVIRPFVEWSIDIPVNRQEYTCNLSRLFPGDGCLGENAGFSTTPSRLSLGARVHPGLNGLALIGAFDIGTGATSDFIEEVAPEMPWNLWLGASFAVDTKPPEPIIQRVEIDRPPAVASVERVIVGTVVEKGAGKPVPNATVRFDGRTFTGMSTGEEGTFRTGNLPAGTYTFNITAPGYRDGQCSATLPSDAAQAAPPPGPYGAQPGMPPGPYTPPGGAPAPGMAPPPGGQVTGGGGPVTIQVQCELEALPKVGNVLGSLVDGESGQPVGGAKVKITDRLNRELELTADGSGAFRFENVPPGPVKIHVAAEGYLPSVTDLEVEPRKDMRAQITIAKRPARPNVVVTAREVKLTRSVHFQHDSADILPDSMALIQEIADVMKKRTELRLLEIQGHTDNTGTEAYNQRLSQERAEAVKKALTDLGVEDNRLTAKGYGQSKPILPNTSDGNRARNRRVQLMILERGK